VQYTENDFYKLIGEKIRISRQALGLSQAELAKRVELRRTSITNIESGQQKIQLYTLYLISDFLNMPINSLLPSHESPETDRKQLISSQKVVTSEGQKKDLSDSDLSNILKIIH
jgi:transcriptional regulator with XRE-family HTH domain